MPSNKNLAGVVPFATQFSLKVLQDAWKNLEPERVWPLDIQEAFSLDGAGLKAWFSRQTGAAGLKNLRLLLSPGIPAGLWETEITAVIPPIEFQPVAATSPFAAIMDHKPTDAGGHDGPEPILCFAWLLAFKQLYGQDLDLDLRPVFQFADPQTGFQRFFQMSMNTEFLRVLPQGKLPVISPEQWEAVHRTPGDLSLLQSLLPAENFSLLGFILLRAQDITETQIVSDLKIRLLSDDDALTRQGIPKVETLLRSYLRISDLHLKIAGLHEGEVTVMHASDLDSEDCWAKENRRYAQADFTGSFFEQAVTKRQALWIDDLEHAPNKTAVEQDMLAHGVRSLLTVPLEADGQSLGVLGLSSCDPAQFGPRELEKLQAVLPLFTVALGRSLENLENRLQALIRERYTAIHPSVSWKFRQTALDLLEQRRQGKTEAAELVFDGVYPLYAASDIRNSSVTRNQAIAHDLEVHLRLALDVLGASRAARDLPIFQELEFQVGQFLVQLEKGLSSGDEIGILHFLRDDVEAAFKDLEHLGPGVQKVLTNYRASLDPAGHFVYQQRKRFDDTVATINQTISDLIEHEQVFAQEMFPHYYDKTSTDGVDFNLYIGDSLAQRRGFDRLYLRNLRLWQFILVCRIARASHKLVPQLPIPLQTTHLIVVQDMPITIRFREDEKRFYVEGAYNTRYEIMKKRIDKATIKGTGQRLTQIDQIALVFTQPSEALEYRRYIAFLQNQGFLLDGVEELELDDLQGIHGLKALRVRVNVEGDFPALTGDLLAPAQEGA